MDKDSARTCRRLGRPPLALVMALALVATLGIAAQQASAYATYEHAGIDDCGTCHQDNHTDRRPTNQPCITCHTGYEVPKPSLTCWVCHLPGQDTSGARNDASCVTTCHLPDGTSVTHAAHPGRSAACTTCHPLTASATDPNGGAHHTLPAPVVASFSPVSGVVGSEVALTGTGFARAAVVAFNGVLAQFVVVSDTQISATVPAAATSGVVAVYNTVGGNGTSAQSFVVVVPPSPPPAPTVASIFPTSGVVGSQVTVTGAGLMGASAVTFNGTPAPAFTVVSDTAITVIVPVGATAGPIAVTTPGGTAASAGSFTVVSAAEITLKVAPTSLLLGRSVKASGLLTPLGLAGGKVTLRVQRWIGGVWVTVKRHSVVSEATGTYRWTYWPPRRGAFHVRVTIAASLTHTAATTKWVKFSVK